MTEVRFYHLRSKTLEQALPELLSKALAQGRRAVVRTPDLDLASRLNDALWSYRPDSFLPHGLKGDAFAADQPVWLTDDPTDNPNGADVLILCQSTDAAEVTDWALVCDMLDGQDEAAVAAGRARWKAYSAAGHTVTYWQQGETGGWEKKA